MIVHIVQVEGGRYLTLKTRDAAKSGLEFTSDLTWATLFESYSEAERMRVRLAKCGARAEVLRFSLEAQPGA